MSTELTPEQQKQVKEQMTDTSYSTGAMVLGLMKEHYGEEAYHVFAKERGKRICASWRKRAEDMGDNSIEALIKCLWEPLLAEGFEYTAEETDAGFQINCTKCSLVDQAKRLGITEQMFYMVCESDPFIAEGFNPNIGFKRTKTLMQGHECCDHFYYYKDKNMQS